MSCELGRVLDACAVCRCGTHVLCCLCVFRSLRMLGSGAVLGAPWWTHCDTGEIAALLFQRGDVTLHERVRSAGIGGLRSFTFLLARVRTPRISA